MENSKEAQVTQDLKEVAPDTQERTNAGSFMSKGRDASAKLIATCSYSVSD